MLLYHGSNQEIISIDLQLCKPYKDFGRGFYLTTIKLQAELMAKRTARIFGGSPYVTTYSFDEDILSDLSLSVKVFPEPSSEWALFVLNNRNRNFHNHSDPNSNHNNKYDIVIGPVANDDIALLFRSFANNQVDLTTLVRGMEYKNLNNQYSFHTSQATALLSKVE
ncbi:MAG: DUF3990 domain-containing protein [Oscillospiraceae bacterium]|nr:DUF3990 domain-containing protein [Oscillospiraceae bacterium]MCL2279856.1 DUF3990 domain-containing protein [Oscillospiraceae bacterium]